MIWIENSWAKGLCLHDKPWMCGWVYCMYGLKPEDWKCTVKLSCLNPMIQPSCDLSAKPNQYMRLHTICIFVSWVFVCARQRRLFFQGSIVVLLFGSWCSHWTLCIVCFRVLRQLCVLYFWKAARLFLRCVIAVLLFGSWCSQWTLSIIVCFRVIRQLCVWYLGKAARLCGVIIWFPM